MCEKTIPSMPTSSYSWKPTFAFDFVEMKKSAADFSSFFISSSLTFQCFVSRQQCQKHIRIRWSFKRMRRQDRRRPRRQPLYVRQTPRLLFQNWHAYSQPPHTRARTNVFSRKTNPSVLSWFGPFHWDAIMEL